MAPDVADAGFGALKTAARSSSYGPSSAAPKHGVRTRTLLLEAILTQRERLLALAQEIRSRRRRAPPVCWRAPDVSPKSHARSVDRKTLRQSDKVTYRRTHTACNVL